MSLTCPGPGKHYRWYHFWPEWLFIVTLYTFLCFAAWKGFWL